MKDNNRIKNNLTANDVRALREKQRIKVYRMYEALVEGQVQNSMEEAGEIKNLKKILSKILSKKM